MDENNNKDDRSVVNTIKNETKKVAKNIQKKITKKIIAWITPVVSLLIICLLAIGVIMAVAYTVINFFRGLLGLDTIGTNTTIQQEAVSIVSITDNGYKINEEYSKKILERLDQLSVNTTIEEQGFYTDGLEDMIDKYIKAEIKTMYPRLGIGENDGLIIIRRQNLNGEVQTLSYKKYSEFCELVDSNNEDSLKYFSLNPDNFNLCLAVAESTKFYNYDDSATDKKVEDTSRRISKITKVESDYQTLVAKYSTPVNYFVSMHVMSGNVQFMNDLVKLVDASKVNIVLTLLETGTIRDTQVDYSGTIAERDWSTNIYTNPLGEPILDKNGNLQFKTSYGDVKNTEINNANVKNYYDSATNYFTEYQSSTGELYVSYAKTWLLNSKLKFTKIDTEKNYIQKDQQVQIPVSDNNVVTNKKASGTLKNGTIIQNTNEWTQDVNTTVTELGTGYNVDDLIELIKSYAKVKNNLTTSPSFLFYLLESQEYTQEQSRVMRYVIAQLANKSYGVDSLELFDSTDFIDIDGDSDITIGDDILAKVELDGSFNVNGVLLSNPLANFKDFVDYPDHKGLDLHSRGGQGDPVYAAAPGKVIKVQGEWNPDMGKSDMASYGNYVIIDHGNGVSTMYAHALKVCVSVGQDVDRGQLIMYEGSTGNSSGAHVHFEIRIGGKANKDLVCQMFGTSPK